MTFTSVAQANSKTAEFSRLFDLFDRVATRRTRALFGDASEVISEDDIANVPSEFAPVLRNLSTILSFRARRDEVHARCAQPAPTTKPRHDTLTSTPSKKSPIEKSMPRVDVIEPSNAVEQDTENPTFPLGERYPFTFKLMLHKLYDLDEWAEKVKDAVETSKSQFKPLAERVQNVTTKRNDVHPALGPSAKFKPPSTTKHPHSAAPSKDATTNVKERGERRTSVRPFLGTSAKFKPPSVTRHPHSAALPTSKPEASRVVKKRCIRRRKSINCPMSTSVWVYDAVISATEVAGARRAVEITLSTLTRRHAGGFGETRVRHRSLTALEEMHTRESARRKVKITVPLLQEGAESAVPLRPSSVSFVEPSREVNESGSVVKKKRSVASVFAADSWKRATVKRPLCV
ncbi:hypothetical protein JVT61DRAFT_4118 [Boletus reticuloceps]|uniref:Uncharacterized protein n=1 Tax=Boletus reticuloceps TaxID=495285 RepID=A0A8I2YPC7_9AGAM|nr:hypothetical protein JVT61DRAFT_4118 [Boletus reticuloceps]